MADLAMGLWALNPEYEYMLSDDKSEIVEWRSELPQPTNEDIIAAWMQCQEAFQLTPDKISIHSSGEDIVTVEIMQPVLDGDSSISVVVNDVAHAVDVEKIDTLGYGYGYLELTSETPGTIINVSGSGAFVGVSVVILVVE